MRKFESREEETRKKFHKSFRELCVLFVCWNDVNGDEFWISKKKKRKK